jgi:hypothetical protein
LNEAKATACIVLDTNALLVPYGTGAQALSQVEQTYRQLLKEGRLIVPAQVAREFARNRVTKLAELHQRLVRRRSQLLSFQQGSYPLLDHLDEYKRLREVEKKLDSLSSEYRDLIASVVEHVKSWEWNDPVSILYGKLLTPDVVVDIVKTTEDVKAEHARRTLHKIPPGYRDESKDDNGIGDLLIWLTILEVGSVRKTSVIFVSGEEKSDWWHRSEGQPLYPRFELVDEYRRASGGQSFHIVKFSELLELYGASSETVAEVREGESLGGAASDSPSASGIGSRTLGGPPVAEHLGRVTHWKQLLGEALTARTWVEFESPIELEVGFRDGSRRTAMVPAQLDGPVALWAVDEDTFSLGFPVRGRGGVTLVATPYELVEAIWRGPEGRLHVRLTGVLILKDGTSRFA